MRDPRCWREVLLRGGMTAILAAIAYFLLDADSWILLLPLGVVLLVLLEWLLHPEEEGEEEERE